MSDIASAPTGTDKHLQPNRRLGCMLPTLVLFILLALTVWYALPTLCAFGLKWGVTRNVAKRVISSCGYRGFAVFVDSPRIYGEKVWTTYILKVCEQAEKSPEERHLLIKSLALTHGTESKYMVLYLCASVGYVSVVRDILSNYKIATTGHPLQYPIVCTVVQNNHPQALEALLDYGFDPDFNAHLPTIPLFYAIQDKYSEVAQTLIKHSSKVKSWTGEYDETLLHLASRTGCDSVIELLLKAGIPVDVEDSRYQTPLMYAVKTNHIKTVRTLLALGANPNASDQSDWTSLYYVARGGDIELADLLLKSGADPQVKDYAGMTPADRALEAGNANVANFLAKACVPQRVPTKEAPHE